MDVLSDDEEDRDVTDVLRLLDELELVVDVLSLDELLPVDVDVLDVLDDDELLVEVLDDDDVVPLSELVELLDVLGVFDDDDVLLSLLDELLDVLGVRLEEDRDDVLLELVDDVGLLDDVELDGVLLDRLWLDTLDVLLELELVDDGVLELLEVLSELELEVLEFVVLLLLSEIETEDGDVEDASAKLNPLLFPPFVFVASVASTMFVVATMSVTSRWRTVNTPCICKVRCVPRVFDSTKTVFVPSPSIVKPSRT